MFNPLCGETAPSVPTTRRLGGAGPNQGLPEPFGAELGPAVFLSSGLPPAVYVSKPSLKRSAAPACRAASATIATINIALVLTRIRPTFRRSGAPTRGQLVNASKL